jgi:hypothetical protein
MSVVIPRVMPPYMDMCITRWTCTMTGFFNSSHFHR